MLLIVRGQVGVLLNFCVTGLQKMKQKDSTFHFAAIKILERVYICYNLELFPRLAYIPYFLKIKVSL
jgi:hypothetical protein